MDFAINTLKQGTPMFAAGSVAAEGLGAYHLSFCQMSTGHQLRIAVSVVLCGYRNTGEGTTVFVTCPGCFFCEMSTLNV